jgi:hypothetical protein
LPASRGRLLRVLEKHLIHSLSPGDPQPDTGMLCDMRLRLFRRRAVEETGEVIASYPFTRRTAHMLLLKDGRVRWTCDCETAQRSVSRNLTPWCKHIEKAAAKRSVDRLFRERPPARPAH